MIRHLIILAILSVVLFGFSRKNDDNKGNRAFYKCSEPLAIDPALFAAEPGKTCFRFAPDLEPTNLKALDFVWLENMPTGKTAV